MRTDSAANHRSGQNVFHLLKDGRVVVASDRISARDYHSEGCHRDAIPLELLCLLVFVHQEISLCHGQRRRLLTSTQDNLDCKEYNWWRCYRSIISASDGHDEWRGGGAGNKSLISRRNGEEIDLARKGWVLITLLMRRMAMNDLLNLAARNNGRSFRGLGSWWRKENSSYQSIEYLWVLANQYKRANEWFTYMSMRNYKFCCKLQHAGGFYQRTFFSISFTNVSRIIWI